MPGYDLRQLHQKLVDILVEFDRVCNEHNLRYSISFGTLIGAVRHKGFIPWDDDLDLMMPRPDYERLIANCREWLPSHLEFVCAENDSSYPLPFGKIQDATTTLIERPHLYYLGGCYIDIFPIDAYPDNSFLRRRQCFEYEFLKQTLYLIHRDPYKHGRGPSSWIPLLARKLFTMEGVQKRLRKVMTRYDFNTCNLAGSYTSGYRKVMPKEVFVNYIPYEFEGHTVMGFRDADRNLSTIYGSDYMTPPPPEKREQHNFYLLLFDKPYREFTEEDLPN